MQSEVPSAIENEIQTLGSLFMDAEGTISDDVYGFLKPNHFFRDDNRKIYAIMLEFYKNRYPVELVTVRDELKKRKQLDEIGGVNYLVELCESIPSATNGLYYAKEVYKAWQRRAVIIGSEKIKNLSYDTSIDITEVLQFNRAIELIVTDLHSSEPIDITIDGVLRVMSDPQHKPKSIFTQFKEIDLMTNGGFEPGEMIVLAARPSMGKTALALNIAYNVAVEQQLPTQIISLEMSNKSIVERMICSAAPIEMWKVRQGFSLSQDSLVRVHEVGDKMKSSPIFFTDKFTYDLDNIKSQARVAHHKHGIKLLIIDYLQLIGGKGEEYERVSKLSREMKLLAHDLDIPVLVLSQLSRALETRSDKRPMLSDLRSSGSIEQDADLVMFLYREDYYHQREPEYIKTNITECIIAKNRNGVTGFVPLLWTGEHTKFSDYNGTPIQG